MDEDSPRILQQQQRDDATATPGGNKGKRRARDSHGGGGSRHVKTPRMTGGATSAAEAGSVTSETAATATTADSADAKDRPVKIPRMTGGETSAAEDESVSSGTAVTATAAISAGAEDPMDVEGSNGTRASSVEGAAPARVSSVGEEVASVASSERGSDGCGGSGASSEAIVDTAQGQEVSPPPAPRCLSKREEPSSAGGAAESSQVVGKTSASAGVGICSRGEDGGGGSAAELAVLPAAGLTSDNAMEAVVDTAQGQEGSPPSVPRCLPRRENPSSMDAAVGKSSSAAGKKSTSAGVGNGNKGGDGGGGLAPEPGVLPAKNLTSDDFTCNICLEMLARPVTLACGHTACEACVARYLQTVDRRRSEHVICPAGCQRRIPQVLPEVSIVDHSLLGKGFPQAYQDRLHAEEGKRRMVTQVRRRAAVHSGSSSRWRDMPERGVAGGRIDGGGVGFGEGRGARVGMRRANAPWHRGGLRGDEDVDPFRDVAAVPQDGLPPTLTRWYKRIGLCLIFFLCMSPSRLHDRTTAGDDLGQHPTYVWRVSQWEDDDAREVTCVSRRMEGEAKESPPNLSAGNGDIEDEEESQRRLECEAVDLASSPALAVGKAETMEMNVKEFMEHNRWVGLRSLYPWNSPWSSTLYLYLSDPILTTPHSHTGGENFPPSSTSDHRAIAPGGKAKPRRMFLEFYGPIVGVFAALGFSVWMSELLTVLAAQMCPFLVAAPLLHLSSVGDFPPDLVIYAVLQLVVTTLTFWRLTWRLYKARGRAIVLLAGVRHLIREAIFIKLVFPLMEHVLFRFILEWSERYAIACAVLSFWIGVMKLVAVVQMVLLVLPLFLIPPDIVHGMEVLWYNLVTNLLLGQRFFKAFVDFANNGNGDELGEDLWRALEELAAAAMAAERAAQRAVAAP